jgi:hypothetical protein
MSCYILIEQATCDLNIVLILLFAICIIKIDADNIYMLKNTDC